MLTCYLLNAHVHTSPRRYVRNSVRFRLKFLLDVDFWGLYFSKDLKFNIRIYNYKYNRNIQESEHDDSYVTATDFGLNQILQG